jgi:putative transposase
VYFSKINKKEKQMALNINDTKFLEIAEIICEEGLSGLDKAIQIIINQAMLIERDRHLKAERYERTPERVSYANGFKPKQLKTRIGKLQLSVPQTRDGKFYPSFLEQGLRSERALKISLAEMYIQGVSTRKVNAILSELCGFEVTSSEVSRAIKELDEQLKAWRERALGQYVYLILDARYEKVRLGGSIQDAAILVAYGVNVEGKREILGVSVDISEAEVHWRTFLQKLCERKLHGLQMVVSDAHKGLRAAIKTVFPSVPWQRCQFHLQQNAQAYVPKVSMKKEVALDIRHIFNAPNIEEANRLLKLTMDKYEKSAPKLSEWLEVSIPEGLQVFQMPKHHQIKIRTTNLAERVNREIKRRTQVVSIFPSDESCERLITAILVEIAEEWMDTDRVYLKMNE